MTPRCWETQHEKCHYHTPFCALQMPVKTRTWEQCSHILAGKAEGKWQIDPFLPIYSRTLEGNSRKSSESVSRVFPEFFWKVPLSRSAFSTAGSFGLWSFAKRLKWGSDAAQKVTLWAPKVTFEALWVKKWVLVSLLSLLCSRTKSLFCLFWARKTISCFLACSCPPLAQTHKAKFTTKKSGKKNDQNGSKTRGRSTLVHHIFVHTLWHKILTYEKWYTLARKYYIHIFVFGINFPINYISVTRRYFSGVNFNFPKITYHVFVCDSENYIEKRFGNYFLGKSHFSYMKYCFRN